METKDFTSQNSKPQVGFLKSNCSISFGVDSQYVRNDCLFKHDLDTLSSKQAWVIDSVLINVIDQFDQFLFMGKMPFVLWGRLLRRSDFF